MEISRSAVKGNARLQMREAKPHPLLVALIFIVIQYIMSNLINRITGYTDYSQALFNAYTDADAAGSREYFERLYPSGLPDTGFVAWLLSTSMRLVLSVLSVGFTMYCLNVSRRLPAAIGNLFDGFGLFFKIIGLLIVEYVFIFLWSILLVIPGIIASYRYRQAFYLLIDHPDWPVMECIRESKRLMTGRKGELFFLDLSFIGWNILEAVPFVSVWVTPYTEITYANYYNALINLENRDWNGGGVPPMGGGYGGPGQEGGYDGPHHEDRDPHRYKEPWERDRD